jgi:glucokinase
MAGQPQYAIGIDLGGGSIKGALVSADGRIEARNRCPTDVESGEHGVADRIAELFESLRDRNGLLTSDIAGIGIGVPGVTTAQGVVIIAPNLRWHHVPFKQILQARIKLNVEIDNDASVAAMGEAHLGAGRGCESLFLITLGTGIGGGLVLDGGIHHGASFAAGEIGHMCMDPDGPVCGCGKKGCLEALTAGPAMVRYVRRRLSEAPSSSLTHTDTLSPESICRAARKGDGLACETVAYVARYLGIAIANIINVVSPDVIAIGGGIAAAGRVLLDPIVAAAREYTLEGMFDYTRVLPAELGNDAGVMGASRLVLK